LFSVGLGPAGAESGQPMAQVYSLRDERRGNALGGDFAHDARMLGVAHRGGFIDQHHGNTVTHVIATLQARVVQRILVGDEIQRTFVLRARKNRQQSGVNDAHRPNATSSGRDELQQCCHMGVALLAGGRFEIEAQQRFGVG